MRPFGCLSPEKFTIADIETSEGFDCEEVLGNGRFQNGLALFAIITMWVVNAHTLAASLISADVDHWCKQPNEVNLSANAWKNIAIPIEADGRHSRCTVYASPGDLNDTTVVECDAWHYDPERANSSIVTEWNLVCSRRSLKALATGVPLACSVVFLVLAGYCADRFGRLPVIQSSAAVVMVAAGGCCFAKSYPMYVACRFLASCSTASLYVATVMILAESCSFQSRPTFLTFSAMMGLMLADTCLAILKQVPHLNWFLLQLIMVAPTLLVPLGFFQVTESPRWLIASRRLNAAESVMLAAAKSNGFQQDHVVLLTQRVRHRLQDKDGLTGPSSVAADVARVVRRRAVIMLGSSFCLLVTFYSLLVYHAEWYAAGPWNQWTPLCANALAFLMLLKIVNRMNKTTLMTSIHFILGSFCCCASIAMFSTGGKPSWNFVSDVILVMARATCSIALVFNLVYVFELYPTPIRGVAVCLSFAFGRLGAMLGALLFLALERLGREDLLFLVVSGVVYCSAYSFRYLPLGYDTYARLADASVTASPASNQTIDDMKKSLTGPPRKRKQSMRSRSSSGAKRLQSASPVL